MEYSIISDNCWGTGVYSCYRKKFLSPFINLFIHTPCFVKLCYDFESYLKEDLRFIPSVSSMYNKKIRFPIALLGDIEICFSHYKIGQEGTIHEDWIRRKKRIDSNRLLFKCGGLYEEGFQSYNNQIHELMQKFHEFPGERKISFTVEKYEFENNFKILDSDLGDAYKLGSRVKQYTNIERLFHE